jgi:group I intron endonuclease
MEDSTTSCSFCVYKITNTLNGKLYIGITIRPLQTRWKQHITQSRTSEYPLHKSMRKYGIDQFTIEVIEMCIDHTTLLQRERYWIECYNTMIPNGYNITAGGEGIFGMHRSEETKRKIANKPITPEFRQRMREIANERAQDPEYIEKLRQANTGKHHTAASISKIREARAKQVFTSDAIEKRSQKNRGRVHTEQSVANMSAAQKDRYISPEHRQKISRTLSLLTDEQAAIVKFDAYGLMQKEYAALFGVSAQTVNGLVRGRTYKHITRDHLPHERDMP